MVVFFHLSKRFIKGHDDDGDGDSPSQDAHTGAEGAVFINDYDDDGNDKLRCPWQAIC